MYKRMPKKIGKQFDLSCFHFFFHLFLYFDVVLSHSDRCYDDDDDYDDDDMG